MFKNEEGFSLLELVVAVGVAGIIAAVALPTFAGLQDKATTTSATYAASASAAEALANSTIGGVNGTTSNNSSYTGGASSSSASSSSSAGFVLPAAMIYGTNAGSAAFGINYVETNRAPSDYLSVTTVRIHAPNGYIITYETNGVNVTMQAFDPATGSMVSAPNHLNVSHNWNGNVYDNAGNVGFSQISSYGAFSNFTYTLDEGFTQLDQNAGTLDVWTN